jgi:hypothetical protein
MSGNAMKAFTVARRLEDRDASDGQEPRGKKPKLHHVESGGPLSHTVVSGGSGTCKFPGMEFWTAYLM